MDKQVYNFSRAKRVYLYVATFALVILGGSLYWEPLHAVCLMLALSCGTLASFLHSRAFRDKATWLNFVATNVAILPMITVTNQFPGFAVFFQYLGFFYVAWPLGMLSFAGFMQIKRDPAATGNRPDHTI